MYILGISGQERSAAAALIRDGQVVAAVAEENLARIARVGISQAGGLPHRAIEFCLERAGTTLDKIDYVAYYVDPYKLFQRETQSGIPLRRSPDGSWSGRVLLVGVPARRRDFGR